MFDVAPVPADRDEQMLPYVFARRDAADLVRAVGQKGVELSAILALAIDDRGTRPIGRWRRPLGSGTFELSAHGVEDIGGQRVASVLLHHVRAGLAAGALRR